jgi:hypothetical protein
VIYTDHNSCMLSPCIKTFVSTLNLHRDTMCHSLSQSESCCVPLLENDMPQLLLVLLYNCYEWFGWLAG